MAKPSPPAHMGVIRTSCFCGSDWYDLTVRFDPDTYDIAAWMLEMTCADCGRGAKAPTPLDHPNYEEDDD